MLKEMLIGTVLSTAILCGNVAFCMVDYGDMNKNEAGKELEENMGENYEEAAENIKNLIKKFKKIKTNKSLIKKLDSVEEDSDETFDKTINELDDILTGIAKTWKSRLDNKDLNKLKEESEELSKAITYNDINDLNGFAGFAKTLNEICDAIQVMIQVNGINQSDPVENQLKETVDVLKKLIIAPATGRGR